MVLKCREQTLMSRVGWVQYDSADGNPLDYGSHLQELKNLRDRQGLRGRMPEWQPQADWDSGQ